MSGPAPQGMGQAVPTAGRRVPENLPNVADKRALSTTITKSRYILWLRRLSSAALVGGHGAIWKFGGVF
ncbi:hypothetical protein PISMIDRAFT_688963 [Pisolithus microcarpus 441]|uniref:Uncharacterized protein n=1 Tax=Pisolithus microcarpus 441 TaxID=765257 RepID=A0A0C9Y8A1_9AGAM|nr:hypothetical protein PISMIDRAFT_688963 [Pisolithus microcarpus 441]